MGQIIAFTIIYTFFLALAYFILRQICNTIIWQPYDYTYQLLSRIGNNWYYIAAIWLVGLIVIIFLCLKKNLYYIDAIIEASSLLVEDNDEQIKLPSILYVIETKMNQIKKTARKNQQLAKENERRKDELVVYLAHDIKTPLTSMIGYLSLLNEIDDMPKKQQQKYLHIALEKSYRLEELVNELFDITRFNSKTINLEKEEINLTLMLEQVIDGFYPVLKERNQRIKLNSTEKIIIEADSDKLARVFNNIINNAINYSKKESDITITINKKEAAVIVKMKNLGKKIPEDKLNKIFEKFYRLDSSRQTKTGGTGLGLAIAKEIVELHHGQISATSDETATEFTIILPIK